jgi:hypothetical protein
MNTEIIDDLHHLSTVSINIPLEKTSINKLIYIDNDHCMEDFLDIQSFSLQNALLKANDNKIEIILKNLNTAIQTNCNNEIDLSNFLLMNELRYNFKINLDEKSISKMYNVTSKFPLEDDLFKIYWLKKFIEDCSKIVENIKTILNIENINLPENDIYDLASNEPNNLLNSVDKIIPNSYSRIFTSEMAYNKFLSLLDEFGNSAENLANYSFVFHKMKRDKLIYDDYQQTQFVFFLLDFDINISRIKSKNQLGKNDLREGIYNRI